MEEPRWELSRHPTGLIEPRVGPGWRGTLSLLLVPAGKVSAPASSSVFQWHPWRRSIKQRSSRCVDRRTDRQAQSEGTGTGGSGPCKHSQIRRSPRHSEGNRGTGRERGAGEEGDAGSAGIPLGKQISN